MTKREAMKRAVAKWGRNAIIRDNGAKLASTPEKRAAARAKRAKLQATLTPEERKVRRKELDALMFDGMRCRYEVGELLMGLAFAIRGSGDTWEQAFESVK